MTTPLRDVTHDHGITREVAEVYSRYGETRQRLRTLGTDEDAISEDFYQSALNVYAATMLLPDALAQLSPADRRETLCSLATIALRWARKVRIGTPPGMPHPVTTGGEKSDDT